MFLTTLKVYDSWQIFKFILTHRVMLWLELANTFCHGCQNFVHRQKSRRTVVSLAEVQEAIFSSQCRGRNRGWGGLLSKMDLAQRP